MTDKELQEVLSKLLQSSQVVVQDTAAFIRGNNSAERKALIRESLDSIKNAVSSIESLIAQ